ncbi:MAG: DNA topoisomerase 3 [Candidatus Riflebacteria bacterium]|nr:DNA topoisomerase 3 [Candidatus Riflebacteria bacterium]
MKKLVFAEKPSVGREIARILNANQRNEGYFEGNNYIVTWGIGHLITLAEPSAQNPDWKNWSISNLPMVPEKWKLSVIPDSAKQFEIVKKLFSRKDIETIINAADAGREGELIFRYVLKHCECSKKVLRLWISSMTDEAITEGFKKLRPSEEFNNLGAAAESRSRADWLVGMNFTRAYTKKFGVMLTVGRVQTPTLAIVVFRQNDIENFKPTDYFEVQLDFGTFKALWNDLKEKENPSRISERNTALKILEKISGKPTKVENLTKSKKKQPPPFLYDLTTLQREANSKFGYSASNTLQIAQILYEKKKVITYPRTDSRFLTDDIHPTLKARFQALPNDYRDYLKEISGKTLSKSKRVFDNSKVHDHHAIIPTEQRIRDINSFTEGERKIYDLIARRFISVFFPDMEYLSTTLLLSCENEFFKASGRIITNPGWRALYDQVSQLIDDDDEEKVSNIPDFKKGELVTPQKSEILTKQTKPPLNYTEATLLQTMETAGRLIKDEEMKLAMKDSGLGTPATRAEIIEKLIRVGYMVREKKKLIPTEKGKELIKLCDPRLKSPELTGDWEKRLTLISRGGESQEKFMLDIAVYVRNLVSAIKSENFLNVKFEETQSLKNQPNRSPLSVQPKLRSQSKLPTKSKLPEQSKLPEKKQSKKINDCEKIGPCPLCKIGKIIEGSRAFGCDRFREGCRFILIEKTFMGKKISPSTVKQILSGKPSRVLKGFISANGDEFSGKLLLNLGTKKVEMVREK